MSNIIINALGISDSGGIAVFDKLLSECSSDDSNNYYVVCNKNKNTNILINKFSIFTNLNFGPVINRGLFWRLYYENIFIRKIAIRNHTRLIYNFSGSFQFFLKIPQVIKIQNLVIFSRKLDLVYWRNSQRLLWIKQVYLKRLLFRFMLNRSKYVEIQSDHVKRNLNHFINVKRKIFYIKSDIDVSDREFSAPRQYDFSKKIKFLYIVGPHFEYTHKNLKDFTNVMLDLNEKGVDFEINITLTMSQLSNSKTWDSSLNTKTNFLGYIDDKQKMNALFCDNTILISTSIIETLGLHVIEGIKNGVLVISPNEDYTDAVYGKNMFTYALFNRNSILRSIMGITNSDPFNEKILSLQDDLRQSEMSKFGSILDVFDEVINVQK